MRPSSGGIRQSPKEIKADLIGFKEMYAAVWGIDLRRCQDNMLEYFTDILCVRPQTLRIGAGVVVVDDGVGMLVVVVVVVISSVQLYALHCDHWMPSL